MFSGQPHLDSGRLEQLLDGRLAGADQLESESHLELCPVCRDRLETTAAAQRYWTEAAAHLRDDALDESSVAVLTGVEGAGRSSAGERLDVLRIVDYFDPTDDPRMLGRFGGYEIVGVVGCGGMGVVLKGFEPALDRYVAIKVLAPHLATSGAARARFAREARAAAAVLHENVVAIHRVAEAAGLPYLVMPYVPGDSLQKRLDERGPLELTEILRIAMQIAAGLAAAHAQGLVHRDIKPGNILLDNGVERVTITDFGLARAADDASLTRSGVITGTPQYMSPEQARGEPVDGRSDLFSLGSVLYAMCTGRPPFRAETAFGVLRRITESAARPIRVVAPDVPEWLCEIVAKLHARPPEERFQSAAEVSELLGRWLAHLQQPTVIARPERVRVSGERRVPKQRAWWIGLAAVALAASGISLAVALHRQPADNASGAESGIGRPHPALRAAVQPQPTELAASLRNAVLSEGQLAAEYADLLQRILQIQRAWSESPDDGGDAWHTELSELQRRVDELAGQINRDLP